MIWGYTASSNPFTRNSLRIFGSLWLLVMTVLVYAYSGLLVGCLTVPAMIKPIETLEDVAASTEVVLYINPTELSGFGKAVMESLIYVFFFFDYFIIFNVVFRRVKLAFGRLLEIRCVVAQMDYIKIQLSMQISVLNIKTTQLLMLLWLLFILKNIHTIDTKFLYEYLF